MRNFDIIKKEIERGIDFEKLLFTLQNILYYAPPKEICLEIENDIYNDIELLIKDLEFYLSDFQIN